MMEQSEYRAQWASNDIRSCFRASHNMQRIANRCSQYLCLKLVRIVDVTNLVNQLNAINIYIIQPANKWAEVRSACLRGEDRLSRRKHQRTICFDAVFRKVTDRLYTVADHRNLHHNIFMKFRQLQAFFNNTIVIGRNYF